MIALGQSPWPFWDADRPLEELARDGRTGDKPRPVPVGTVGVACPACVGVWYIADAVTLGNSGTSPKERWWN